MVATECCTEILCPLIHYKWVFLYHTAYSCNCCRVWPDSLSFWVVSGLIYINCILFYEMNTFSYSLYVGYSEIIFLVLLMVICEFGYISLLNAYIASLTWLVKVSQCCMFVQGASNFFNSYIDLLDKIYTHGSDVFFFESSLSLFNISSCSTFCLFAPYVRNSVGFL